MMNNDKLIRLSTAVDLCMKKAKFYQPEMFGTDQECFTAKLVATELAGEIRNLPSVDAEPVRHASLKETGYDEAWAPWGDCTNCGCSNIVGSKYCNDCGARMDGGAAE